MIKPFANLQALTTKEGTLFLNTLPKEQDAYLRLLKQQTTTPLRTLLPNNTPTNEVLKLALKPTTPRESNERNWKTLFVNPVALSNPEDTSLSAKIDIRTRNDDPSKTVPERLYSSLKYEISHTIPIEMFGKDIAVIMAKVQVVNPYKHEEEIVKNNGKTVLKGASSMTPITINAKQDALTCKQKIQFTDVSYHHEKKFFALKISYYKPANLKDPILVMLSAPFQVFARRPRKNRRTTKKRKKTEEEEEEEIQPKKMKKVITSQPPKQPEGPSEEHIKQEILKFLDIFEKYQDVVQNLDEETKNKLNTLLAKMAQPVIKLEEEDMLQNSEPLILSNLEDSVPVVVKDLPVVVKEEPILKMETLPLPSSSFESLQTNELDLDSLFDFTD
jgi:hypothetical protein